MSLRDLRLRVYRVCIIVLAGLAWPAVTFADTVRVTKDRATIWRRPSLVLAVVKAGAVLEVVGKEGQWYYVLLPADLGDPELVGFIYEGHVEPVLVPGRVTEQRPRPAPPVQRRPSAPTRRLVVEPRLFGHYGRMSFAAGDSFKAIFGESVGQMFGGGIQVVLKNGAFIEGAAERFRKKGQRIFIFEGEVVPTGVEDTVTVTPITFTAGYRFSLHRRMIPYVGAGGGSYRLRERSLSATDQENVDEQYPGFHILGGIEVAAGGRFATAFEVQYASVPKALGVGGVSREFDEKNLGGVTLRVKVLIGN